MRTISVVTVGRSDYSIYLPILRKIQGDPNLDLRVTVAGMHLAPAFGLTVKDIEADGFAVTERVEMLLASDTPEGIAKSIGLGVIGFAQTYSRYRPDILVVLGDRFEMYAAALAALPFKIPVAHIHGGELTEGAIDDALRHSITKLSHLHFVSTQEHAERVLQMGEERWRIVVAGAPSLDNLHSLKLLPLEALERKYGTSFKEPPLLVTFHPVTLEYEHTRDQVTELLEALAALARPVVFTLPNADTNGHIIGEMIREFVKRQPFCWLLDNLGTADYYSMMACAAAMVGNSSSGIIEAPSLGLPVVNIGTRQRGRMRAANVIDVGYGRAEIIRGLEKALVPAFRAGLRNLANPYDKGRAAELIVEKIKNVTLDDDLVRKRFVHLSPWPVDGESARAS